MSTSNTSDSSSRRTAVIVVAIGAVAFAAWYFTRPSAATVDINDALGGASETASATESTATETTDPTAPEATTDGATESTGATEPATEDASTTATEDGSPSGTWTVTTDAVPYDYDNAEGTFVGFRVEEELSRIGAAEAVGRTPAVTGELTLDDTMLSAASFTTDLTQITSDRSQRQRAIQSALNTGEHPEATFELTEPVDLGEIPAPGEAVEVDVTGDLTVNGTTVTDTFPLQGGLTNDDNLVVTGSFDLPLSDVGVDAPSAPIVVSVSDTATVEFQVYLQK